MAQLIQPVIAGIGAAASSAGAAVSGAFGGASISSILQGGATVLGIAQAFQAGNAEADRYTMEAADAETEQALETLQGLERRTQARKAVMQAVGSLDTAYAAGGVDLSFGTVNQARSEIFREGDRAVATAGNTELTRVARLAERAKMYRISAKRARRGGYLDGLIGGAKGFASILNRGG